MMKTEQNPDAGKSPIPVDLYGEDEEMLIEVPKTLMKRDWTTVPCVRESFLFSIPSSILLGISRFMLTSNVPKSTNLSVFSFCGITLATWVVCRINLVNEQFKVKQLQEGVKNYIEKIGTKDDKSK